MGCSTIHWFLVFSACLFSSSMAYRNIRLEDNICADRLLVKLKHQFKEPSMTLLEDRDSAAIISQQWNQTLPGFYSNKIRYDCEFKVQSSEDLRTKPRGIYTVITLLKFRRDPVTDECMDYIQFRNGNRSPSAKICDDISIGGPSGNLAFDQRDRDVTVIIHINKTRMIVEPLKLRMVLTAHSECKFTGDFLCDPAVPHSCISRYLVRDNITNCMYPCRDEVSCFHDVVPAAEVDTTSVAISAITSLIFTMLGVGFCIWICWKYWNCITVQQHAHEASAVASRRQAHRSQQQQRTNSREVPVIELPMAPSFTVATTTTSHNINSNQMPQDHREDAQKDLPPSYESLFPDS